MAQRGEIIGDVSFIKNSPKETRNDINGKPLYVGSTVEMPEPEPDDLWNFPFVGTIACFRGDYATVMDMDGDHFDIEPDRLTSQEEEQ
jgi:hypothetical protein